MLSAAGSLKWGWQVFPAFFLSFFQIHDFDSLMPSYAARTYEYEYRATESITSDFVILTFVYIMKP